MAISSCPTCGYPIAVYAKGQEAVCAYCNDTSIAQGVTLPSGFFWGVIGLVTGVILGPAILSSTEAGSKWLAKQARARLEK